MTHHMFIVKHDGKHHGPFNDHELGAFTSRLHGEVEVIPLWLPPVADS